MVKKLRKSNLNQKKQFTPKPRRIKVKIIGIGGGGSSIVLDIAKNLKGVKFAIVDCDRQVFRKAKANVKATLVGEKLTKGLGTGLDKDLSREVLQNSKEKISQLFKNADILIFVISLGGGFGSTAASFLAEMTKKVQGVTLGIFTLPFSFEGEKKQAMAREALESLEGNLGGKIIVANDKIFNFIDKKTSFRKSLSLLNRRLIGPLSSLIEIISKPGIINLDFADLKTIFKGKGKLVYLKTIQAEGPNKVEEITKNIFHSSIYTSNSLTNFQRILVNIAGGKNLTLKEVEALANKICDINPRAKIILGISEIPKYNDKVRITFIGVSNGDNRGRHFKTPEKKGQQKGAKKGKEGRSQSQKKSFKKPLKKIKAIQPLKGGKEQVIKKRKAEYAFPRVRRSALEIKKAEEKAQDEELAREKEWEIPAFLRRKTSK